MRRPIYLGAILLTIVVVGAFWYGVVEDFGFEDGLYMAVISLTTVGYGEVHPLDASGRAFTIVYLLTGVGVLFYVVTVEVETVVVGGVADAFGLRRNRGKVRRMHDHVIICGFGRVGREITETLTQRGTRHVVVDLDAEATRAISGEYVATVVGDATQETTLREAGIERARTLIAAADSDVQNTYIVLTARALNPSLFIVARAGSDSAERRLTAAGADSVVSPYQMGGRRMALAAVQPTLNQFVDRITTIEADGGHVLAEVIVEDTPRGLVGRTIAAVTAEVPAVHILGMERDDEGFTVGPRGAVTLRRGDRLFVYGDSEEVAAMARQAGAG
ncbi:MAG: potassium channel protein [Dehalococcoidia bacterium]|nr:MAG: potassium channel protein [Dehalococcoidia bacterium]